MSAYSDFRFALLQRIFAEWLTPIQVAEALEREGLSQACGSEISQYRAYGDRWPGAAQKPRLAAVLPAADPITPEPEQSPAPEQGPSQGDWELLA